MIELKSNKIKNEIVDICNYFEEVNNNHELSYNKGFDKIKVLSEINIIKSSVSQGNTFEIAFVGEYNAGKTSVINLLTNNVYIVDTNVATAKSTKSKWYDYTLIDTPGLGSGKPDHDEETKKWLAEADLLIYFLTPDLLTNNAGERLAMILKDFNRTKELMLVMNMIDQEGNDLDVYKEELQSVIEPMLLSDYYPSFISAKYMEQSIEMIDIDDVNYYREKSNFDVFINTLNLFVMTKKQKALLSTPLTRIYTLSQSFNTKSEFDKELEFLSNKLVLFNDTEKSIKQLYDNFKIDLKSFATETSGNVFRAITDPPKEFEKYLEEEFTQFTTKTSEKVEHIINVSIAILSTFEEANLVIDNSVLAKEIKERISTSATLKTIFESISKINLKTKDDKSDLYDELLNQTKNINNKFGGEKIEINKEVLNSKNFIDFSSKLISKIDPKVVTTTMRNYGYKFARGEAVKLRSTVAKKTAKSIPILNVAAVVWDVSSYFYNKNKDKKREAGIIKFKEELKTSLNNAQDEMIKSIDNDFFNPIFKNMEKLELLYNSKKNELLSYSEVNKSLIIELEKKREYCLSIHNTIYE